jgi:renalase
MTHIAIIGTGLSALTAAYHLQDKARITFFEKSRGLGGRLATRYAGPFTFDHGAQFFTAQTEDFRNFIKPLLTHGVIKRWDGPFAEFDGSIVTNRRQWSDEPSHYVGVPSMNIIGKYITNNWLKEPAIHLNTRVTMIRQQANNWYVFDDTGQKRGPFDWVISTAPAAQTAALLPPTFCHHKKVAQTQMAGCFSLMLGFHQPLHLTFNAALVKNQDISWISVNSSKPDRNYGFTLLVNSTNKWAEKHINDPKEQVINHLCASVQQVINQDVHEADHKDVHAWNYANIEKQPGPYTPLIDEKNKLAACGDWCIQGRAESAFTSGFNLAIHLLAHLDTK